MTNTAQIEAWLLAQSGWVSAADLCAACGIDDERKLRYLGNVPGLISEFAISHSRKGYRHVRNATTMEWLKFKWSLLRTGIAYFRHVRAMAKVRRNVTLPAFPTIEKDTGQRILL